MIAISVAIAVAIMIVVIVPAAAITVVIPVPAMVVVEAASVTIPIAGEETVSIMMRHYPARARIGRKRPVAVMPSIAPVNRIPVAFDPNVIGSRPPRQHTNNARWRRWANPDTN